jgi:hypothetical protein
MEVRIHILMAMAVLLTTASLARADLRVEPNPVQMDDLSETALIHVYQDGQPVRNFSTLRFVAPKYAYSMYTAKPVPGNPGAVLVTPVAGRAEDGSFTLLIGAGGEQTTVDVLMTLPVRPVPGVTIQLEKPDSLKLPIADEYPLGLLIHPAIEPITGRRYEWWVNNELANRGVDGSSMDILADKLGAHTVRLQEYEGDRLTAEGTATFNVVPESAVVVETQVGRPVLLQGDSPSVGPFSRFEWFQDQQTLGGGPRLSFAAPVPGDHKIVLRASDSTDNTFPYIFREIHWIIRAR